MAEERIATKSKEKGKRKSVIIFSDLIVILLKLSAKQIKAVGLTRQGVLLTTVFWKVKQQLNPDPDLNASQG